jgi:hypothetical protein
VCFGTVEGVPTGVVEVEEEGARGWSRFCLAGRNAHLENAAKLLRTQVINASQKVGRPGRPAFVWSSVQKAVE